MDERYGSVDDDGYRHFALPGFGTVRLASTEQVNAVCDDWYVAELEFIKRLMRRVASGWDPDAEQYAAAVTALAYFHAVRNGNGMARFVRDHLEGRTPIREPKGLFIRTIELHRSAASREAQQESRVRRREVQTTFEDHEHVAGADRNALSSDLGPVSYDGVHIDRCLRIRADLIEIAAAKDATPVMVEDRLAALELLCSEEVERRQVLSSLTARQRLVFLLRVDPLPAVDALAVDYELIASLCRILGRPATATALRQSLREALLRLRIDHSAMKDDLTHG
jgi:hypothetical protein